MRFVTAEERYPPERTGELEPADYILLTAYRRWIAGWARSDPALWERVWNDLARHLGPARGKVAVSTLAAVVNVLRRDARRPIRYHQPCCACIGEDETCFLRLVAAARNGHWLAAREAGRSMVSDESVGDLMASAAQLARTVPVTGRFAAPSAGNVTTVRSSRVH